MLRIPRLFQRPCQAIALSIGRTDKTKRPSEIIGKINNLRKRKIFVAQRHNSCIKRVSTNIIHAPQCQKTLPSPSATAATENIGRRHRQPHNSAYHNPPSIHGRAATRFPRLSRCSRCTDFSVIRRLLMR